MVEPIPPAIKAALDELRAHETVADVEIVSTSATHVIVVAGFQVNLPSREGARGASLTGVRAVEPITITFPADFPLFPMTLALRQDFNRELPHINPGHPDDPPVPCLFDGGTAELLLSDGFKLIVGQIDRWLDNAARGILMTEAHGWEPIRRDELPHTFTVDATVIRGMVDGKGRHVFLPVRYGATESDGTGHEFVHAVIGCERIAMSPEALPKLMRDIDRKTERRRGHSVALVALPTKLGSGQMPLADRYRPETITTYDELLLRSEEYGCKRSLEEGFSWLSRCAVGWSSGERTFPVPIILVAVRPYNLIGTSTNLEIMPYLVMVEAPMPLETIGAARVDPAGLIDSVSVTLLRKMSAEPEAPIDRETVLLGCGSLGSHIGVGLARMGAAPTVVVDNKRFRAHNIARHALIPIPEYPESGIVGNKAVVMASACQGFSQTVRPVEENAINILRSARRRSDVIPKRTWAVVNATASLRVREALMTLSAKDLPTRVIETSLYANGRLGLMTVEGPNRNPDVGDLIAQTYEIARTNDRIRDLLFSGTDGMVRQTIGQGCGTLTMAMPDSQLSIFASSMTMKIRQLRSSGMPMNGGSVGIARLTDDYALAWDQHDIPPVVVLEDAAAAGWKVRLAKAVDQAIRSDVAGHPAVETGGIVMGRISLAARTFYVTATLPAPNDSVREMALFVLGVSDRAKVIDEYTEQSSGALYCLGTWHSHLMPSGPSAQDRRTAESIRRERSAPLLMLIHTPTGYRALVEEG